MKNSFKYLFVLLTMATWLGNQKAFGQSAIGQLESMTGQKINRGSSSSNYNYNAEMNTMIAGTIAQGLIASIFGSTNRSIQPVHEAKTQPSTLTTQFAGEQQRVQLALLLAKHKKLMELYKFLDGTQNTMYKPLSGSINYKAISDVSAPMTQEEHERQNLIKHGVSLTWDFNSWAQINENSGEIEAANSYKKTKADNYLDDAINKIETLPGGVGRIPALAGRFMVNIKDETMSYLNDATNAAVSNNISRMEETGQVDLGKKIANNALIKSAKQTVNAYVDQGKDVVKGFFDDGMKETNFGLLKSASEDLLKSLKIYAPTSNAWKVGLKKY